MCEQIVVVAVLAFMGMLVIIGVAIGRASIGQTPSPLRCPGCSRHWPEPFDSCAACGWVRGVNNRRDDLAEWTITAHRLPPVDSAPRSGIFFR